MVANLKRNPFVPLLRVIESIQGNESYLWDTALGSFDPLGLSTLPRASHTAPPNLLEMIKEIGGPIDKALRIWPGCYNCQGMIRHMSAGIKPNLIRHSVRIELSVRWSICSYQSLLYQQNMKGKASCRRRETTTGEAGLRESRPRNRYSKKDLSLQKRRIMISRKN